MEEDQDSSWRAPDGTLYFRDSGGRWKYAGYERGMSDAHFLEWAKERSVLEGQRQATGYAEADIERWRALEARVREAHWYKELRNTDTGAGTLWCDGCCDRVEECPYYEILEGEEE